MKNIPYYIVMILEYLYEHKNTLNKCASSDLILPI